MKDDKPLANRIALVTGAQQGIGYEIARALGRDGARIIANYIDDRAGADRLADEIAKSGGECHPICADLADPQQIDALLARCDALGGVDILVNNAAVFPREDFLSMQPDTWQQTMAVNLGAPFRCSQLAARQMVANGGGGSIVNITSGAAFRGSPRAVHYVSSKAGLVGLTRSTALELAPHQIRVNAVAPGLTDTAQPRFGMSESEIAEAGKLVPLGNIAEAGDIAPVVQFLVSDAAAHITGQTWHVNGGQYLY